MAAFKPSGNDELANEEKEWQAKMASLRKQLDEIRNGTHPAYTQDEQLLRDNLNERFSEIDYRRQYEITCAERDYVREKRAALNDFEGKTKELMKNYRSNLEAQLRASVNEELASKEEWQAKMASLRNQLDDLKNGTHPAYTQNEQLLRDTLNERISNIEYWRQYEITCAERDYVREKRAALNDFERKQKELMRNYRSSLEAQQRSYKKALKDGFPKADVNGECDLMDLHKRRITRGSRRCVGESQLGSPEVPDESKSKQLVFLIPPNETQNDLMQIRDGPHPDNKDGTK